MRNKQTRWTVADIAQANEAGGYYFFSVGTQRFFGDRRSNYGVRHINGEVYLVRNKPPSRPPADVAASWVGQAYRFDPETGDVRKVDALPERKRGAA